MKSRRRWALQSLPSRRALSRAVKPFGKHWKGGVCMDEFQGKRSSARRAGCVALRPEWRPLSRAALDRLCRETAESRKKAFHRPCVCLRRPAGRSERCRGGGAQSFEQFGQSERRFAEIAPQTVIDSETASIQTERTGTVTASITNAYYDGESLLIGYTIQGNTSFEPFSPTAKELTHMQPTDDVPDWLHAKNGRFGPLPKLGENTKQAGMPWGVVPLSRLSFRSHLHGRGA